MAAETVSITASASFDITGIDIFVVEIHDAASPVILHLDNFVLGKFFQLIVWYQTSTPIQFSLTATDNNAVTSTVYMNSGGGLTDISNNLTTLAGDSVYSLLGTLVMPTPTATVPILFLALI